MASYPHTWQMLQSIQQRVQSEVLLPVGAGTTSPFDIFQASDAAAFASNPFGTITNAIFIGVPKDFKPYSALCTLMPTTDMAYRRAFGGKIWDDMSVAVRIWFNLTANWYGQYQTLINTRDAFQLVIQKHAELPNAPAVQAAKNEIGKSSGLPMGFTIDTQIGRDWYCWDGVWSFRQEWNISGGIVA